VPNEGGDEPQSGFLEVSIYVPAVLLTVGDTCAEAVGLVPVTTGTYEVDLDGFANDMDLADGADPPCTDGFRTPGNDAFLEVVLEDDEYLDVRYDASISTLGTTNGSVYLLETCGDVDACIVGSDSGNPETLQYQNTSGGQETLYLVLDSWSSWGGPDAGILVVEIYE